MLTRTEQTPGLQQTPTHAPVLVIGGGPVGMRAAQSLQRAGQSVTVLSAEALPPYNRVRLTPLLGGDVQFGEITLPDAPENSDSFHLELGQRVRRIEREDKRVIAADGSVWTYDTLIIATGSSAFVPGIPGKDLPGVYTFRSAEDASALLARSFSARRVAVIGGGLLGLEAARGMRQRGCDVTVIEHENRLMPRQLDAQGGARLKDKIEEIGVQVVTGQAVKEISGPYRVTGLSLSNGETIDCDTVIICTGVRANLKLAQESKLAFNRGIIVDDQMRTSDPDIFAVGECAEHQSQLYGLVGPGYAQADVAVATLTGQESRFTPQLPATKLKVIGAEVFSVGEVEQLEVKPGVKSYSWSEDGTYRRVFIDRGTLAGAIAVGGWSQASRIQDAVEQGLSIYPWNLFRFRRTGVFWPEEDLAPDGMPDTATLCNCTGVTCGQVRGALAGGCTSVDAVSLETGAGGVCGTCRPLIEELVDAGAKPQPLPLWKPVLAFSALAFLGAIYPLLLGYVPLPESYDADSLRTWLWRDNIVKQWSGFILLGMTLAAFVLGLRKRIRFMDRLGGFAGWRLVHNVIGLAALAGFFAHTGFNLGSGWNLALGLTFVGSILIGAVAGLATGGDHELRARRIGSSRKPPRKLPTWVHILTLWPLPALLLFHVLASYAF
ncbi:FAD-dependent oxidoreductase [Actibacterium atlanticum]|nr:FAD-dependent oxidoreductase [Actibacterium atlanticum]